MDYYQKYQKYKLKYYNLLNQSGGSNYSYIYNYDEFFKLKKKRVMI